MATKTIPAKQVIICDCCGVESGKAMFSLAGKWRHLRRVPDCLGNSTGPLENNYDLCDDCERTLSQIFNNAFAELKAGAATEGGGK